MSDAASLVGAYALDAVSDVERRMVERHLAECADCQADLASFRETSVLLAGTVAQSPSETSRTLTLDAVRTVRPLPPAPSERGSLQDGPHRLRRPRRLWLAVAAAVVTTGCVGAGLEAWHLRGDDSPSAAAPSPTQLVLSAPDAEEVRVDVGQARATVVRSKSEGRAVIVTEGMPPAPEGNEYEIWFETPEGDMVSAGTMPRRTDQTLLLDGDAREARSVAITVEPLTAGPGPSSDPVVVFDLPG